MSWDAAIVWLSLLTDPYQPLISTEGNIIVPHDGGKSLLAPFWIGGMRVLTNL